MWSKNFQNAVLGEIEAGVDAATLNENIIKRNRVSFGNNRSVYSTGSLPGSTEYFVTGATAASFDCTFVDMTGQDDTVEGRCALDIYSKVAHIYIGKKSGVFKWAIVGETAVIDSENCTLIYDDGTNKIGISDLYINGTQFTPVLSFSGSSAVFENMTGYFCVTANYANKTIS